MTTYAFIRSELVFLPIDLLSLFRSAPVSIPGCHSVWLLCSSNAASFSQGDAAVQQGAGIHPASHGRRFQHGGDRDHGIPATGTDKRLEKITLSNVITESLRSAQISELSECRLWRTPRVLYLDQLCMDSHIKFGWL